MQVVIVLIGASLLVALGFLFAYLWAVKSGQYEDKYTPSIRILFDDKANGSSEASDSKIGMRNKEK